jgi:hypothetical protein
MMCWVVSLLVASKCRRLGAGLSGDKRLPALTRVKLEREAEDHNKRFAVSFVSSM